VVLPELDVVAPRGPVLVPLCEIVAAEAIEVAARPSARLRAVWKWAFIVYSPKTSGMVPRYRRSRRKLGGRALRILSGMLATMSV
jgi:hypothetical protein